MNPSELQRSVLNIQDAFPFVKRRFNESPRVLEEWTKALRPLQAEMVDEGISRWIRHNNMDPTLDNFLGLLDGIAEERRHKAARGPVVLEEPVDEPPFDAVPLEEIQALLTDLYAVFDKRQAAMDNERRRRRGATWEEKEGKPKHGLPPACSLRQPLMSLPEAKAVQVQLLKRPQVESTRRTGNTRSQEAPHA